MTEKLHAAIRAIALLNSWVRSPSYRDSTAKNFVYNLKNQAVKRVHDDGLSETRTIKVKTTCRQCGGSGEYVDSYGIKWPHCRACYSSGVVALLFVETTIKVKHGPLDCIRWHTPYLKHPLATGDMGLNAVEDTQWQPNQLGESLPINEVCKCLMVAEAEFKDRPPLRYEDYGTFDPCNYQLDFGDRPNFSCGICGRTTASTGCNYAVGSKRIIWHDRACQTCDVFYSHIGGSIFERFSYPMDLFKDDNVLKWIRTHPWLERKDVPSTLKAEVPF